MCVQTFCPRCSNGIYANGNGQNSENEEEEEEEEADCPGKHGLEPMKQTKPDAVVCPGCMLQRLFSALSEPINFIDITTLLSPASIRLDAVANGFTMPRVPHL